MIDGPQLDGVGLCVFCPSRRRRRRSNPTTVVTEFGLSVCCYVRGPARSFIDIGETVFERPSYIYIYCTCANIIRHVHTFLMRFSIVSRNSQRSVDGTFNVDWNVFRTKLMGTRWFDYL